MIQCTQSGPKWAWVDELILVFKNYLCHRKIFYDRTTHFSIQSSTSRSFNAQPIKANLYSNVYCYVCTGFAIDSELYLFGTWKKTSNVKYFHLYEIDDSTETFRIHYKNYEFFRYDPFRMKDFIFFDTNAGVPKVSCDVGYRNENNRCVDIDECKIIRHYCDSRNRLKL